ESPGNPMPPRTIEESHRPRASDRTMHCHSSSGQSYRLVVSENDGRRHNSEMEPQGRTIASPSRTRRQSKTLCLKKTALRVRNYVQTVGLNAETKKDRHLCSSVDGFRTMAERRTRAGFMKRVHKPAMIRSVARRLGARLRPRLRMRS